jgi:hypothetical protein
MHVIVRGEQLEASHKTSMARGAEKGCWWKWGEGGPATGKTSASTFQPPCGRACESEKRRLCDANGKSDMCIRVGDIIPNAETGGIKDDGELEARV